MFIKANISNRQESTFLAVDLKDIVGVEYEFPEGFLWGASASACQMEAARNEDGDGESVWDLFAQPTAHVLNGDTGDASCGHYHPCRQGATIVHSLGTSCHGFGPSWTRILPAGRGEVSHKGLESL